MVFGSIPRGEGGYMWEICFPMHPTVMTTFEFLPKCYYGISSFMSFLQKEICITNNGEDQILRKDFGVAYRNYCVQNNLPQASVIDFIGHLIQLGITRKNINSSYVLCGVAWKKTKVKSYDANTKVHGVEYNAVGNSLSSYAPRHFIKFAQSYLVFTLEEEHCTTQEELEISYQKFCKRRSVRKSSLLDMKSVMISANVKCLDLKHAGGGKCCVFLGVQLLRNIVKKDMEIMPVQVNEATTLPSDTKTNGTMLKIIANEKAKGFKRWVAGVKLEKELRNLVENYQYCTKASGKTGITVSDISERNGKVDVASNVGIYPKYSCCPVRKDDQELVDRGKANCLLDINVNNEMKDQYSLLKGSQLEKLCTRAESSLNTNTESVHENFTLSNENENVDKLLCDMSVNNRPTLYKMPRSTDARQGNLNDPGNLSGSPMNDGCAFKGNCMKITNVDHANVFDIERNDSMNYVNVENSSTLCCLSKKPKKIGEIVNALASKPHRWVVGVKLDNIRVCENDSYLGTGTLKKLENSLDKSHKRPEKENLFSYELAFENNGNCEGLVNFGSDHYMNEKEDCSELSMTVKANSGMGYETKLKKSSLPLRENQARNANNVSDSEQFDGDGNNLEEKEDESYICGTKRKSVEDEVTENCQSGKTNLGVCGEERLGSDFDLQRNHFITLLDHSSGNYLPPRNAHIRQMVSNIENNFKGFNSDQSENVRCTLSVLLQDIIKGSELKTEYFGRKNKRIKIEEPDLYLDHNTGNHKIKRTIEEDISHMMSYLRERGKPMRLVSGVLLSDIRRYPQYQSKLNFYKDEFGYWILVRPSFMYDGFESFRKFIKANICFTGKPHNLIMRGDLYAVYKTFCSKRSLRKASLEDIEHHLSVMGIRSHFNIVQTITPELAFSGLSWKKKALLNKFGNKHFNVIIHDYTI